MKYELIYIIDPDVEEEGRKALIDKFNSLIEANEGTVDKVDEWGKRHLAYPINDKNEGYYVLVNFSSETSLPREMERNLGITENIMRYLVTRVDEKTSKVKPKAPSAPRAFNREDAPAEQPAAEQPAEAPVETPADAE